MSRTMFIFTSALLVLASLTSVFAYTGDGTFYEPGLGACGWVHSENDYIVAIAHTGFDTYPGATPNPNDNPICGRNLKATFEGRSVVVTLVDRCGDCPGDSDIDMSPIAFHHLADYDRGRLHGVEWDWTDSPAGPVTEQGNWRKREMPFE